MLKCKAYQVYIEDREGVYREVIPAPTPKYAEKIMRDVYGYEPILIKELDPDMVTISQGYLAEIMRKKGFGQTETDIVTRLLQYYYEYTQN